MIFNKSVYNMVILNKNKILIYACEILNNKKYFINHSKL